MLVTPSVPAVLTCEETVLFIKFSYIIRFILCRKKKDNFYVDLCLCEMFNSVQETR